MFDVNHSPRPVYLAIAGSRQVVEVRGRLVEPRTIPRAKYFVVAGKGFEVGGRLRRTGVALKAGQVVSRVETVEIVDVGAVGFATVGNGLQRPDCLADID